MCAFVVVCVHAFVVCVCVCMHACVYVCAMQDSFSYCNVFFPQVELCSYLDNYNSYAFIHFFIDLN